LIEAALMVSDWTFYTAAATAILTLAVLSVILVIFFVFNGFLDTIYLND
jgi:hypothetical protein